MSIETIRSMIEASLGTVYDLEEEAPGVWYCAFQEPGNSYASEYDLVDRASDTVSPAAKDYGTPLKDHPELLCYDREVPDSGYQVILYELALYRHRNAPTPETLQTLRSAAVFGAEDHPEYFGEYPVPLETPRGRTLRSKRIWNGVFCLETDSGARMLAFCYPIWKGLSLEVREYGEQAMSDRVELIDNTCGYLFFRWEISHIPMNEWLDSAPDRGDAGIEYLKFC